MKKLICFDLDGTLTQNRSKLEQENKELLDKLGKKYKLLMVGAGGVERIYTQMNEYPKKEVKTEKKWKPLSKVLLICGAFLAFAVFVVNMLVTELGKTVESAILFSVSYAISIIITILVGALYYKEKITWKNALGIVLCVGSLAIINFL